ncbi:MAG: ABC transporter ATP-binding protein [Gammaproteobacteria bacterium]|nr:MAG: ABC transporter ATP-binding protein [Gammaproteobacteria bacterium]
MRQSILEIKQLERHIDKLKIIRGISAQVGSGDVIALLGKNGAGKTTLIETLLGFSYPTHGDVKLWGTPATKIDGDIKSKIGFVPQQSELISHISVADQIHLFRRFRHNWNQPLVEKFIDEWEIPVKKTVAKLSVGQQQKLSILLAIAHEPQLLMLDEPVASLDPIARRQFLQQLIEIASDAERAIVFSTHIISDVERIANEVWMLRDGILAYQGGLDELKESVARITIHASQPLPAGFNFPNIIRQRIQGNQAVVAFSQWTNEIGYQIENVYRAKVQVEYLSLEDIFLEMNNG